MVPASTFMYGSILMLVTFNPMVLSNKPVEEAASRCNQPLSCLIRLFEGSLRACGAHLLTNYALSNTGNDS